MPTCASKIRLLVLLGSSVVATTSGAVERADPQRWEPQMEKFAEVDRREPPPENGIVFVGSSSIVGWKLDKYFPNLPVINRGFGGSHIADSTFYADRIILKYKPKIVVFYAGDNDVAHGLGVDEVVADYRKFVAKVHAGRPDTHIVYVAIKPSIKRWTMVDTMRAANRQIRKIASSDPRQAFLDIARPMLREDGTPRPELFVEDGLHLNAQGYELWSELLRPVLHERFQP